MKNSATQNVGIFAALRQAMGKQSETSEQRRGKDGFNGR